MCRRPLSSGSPRWCPRVRRPHAWRTSAGPSAGITVAPAIAYPATTAGSPTTTTAPTSRALDQDDRDDETVDRDAFGEPDNHHRAAEQFRSLAERCQRSRPGVGDGDRGADRGPRDGDRRTQQGCPVTTRTGGPGSRPCPPRPDPRSELGPAPLRRPAAPPRLRHRTAAPPNEPRRRNNIRLVANPVIERGQRDNPRQHVSASNGIT